MLAEPEAKQYILRIALPTVQFGGYKFAQKQVLNFLCIDLLTPPTVPDMQGIILGHSRNPMRHPHLRLQFQPPSTFPPIQIHKVSCSDFKDYYPFYLSSRSGSGQDGEVKR